MSIFRGVRCFVVLFLLVSLPAFAQSGKGVISGTVVDGSGAVLKGAEVRLLPLNILRVTNESGVFAFPRVAAGHYTVKVNFVGFETKETPVELGATNDASLNIVLAVSNKSEEILVAAERPHGEAEAINETRTADNILQILPQELIVSLPNANAADAIGRLPSVTLYRIEGEGVYIQVRGTEPRLTNVTVNGITLPAPEPTVRQVRLDVLPSALIEAVEINKTLSANMDANGIGGSVNIRTKTAGEMPTLDVFSTLGYTNILNGRYSSEDGLTVSDRFGKSKKLGVLFNAAYDYNGRGIDNFQPALDPYSTFAAPFYDSNTIREYRYYRYRYGFAGNVDYRINDSNNVYATGIYSDLKDWGDKWYYAPQSQPLKSTGVLNTSKTAPAPKFYTSSKRPNASVSSTMFGYRHTGAKSWFNFNGSASYSYEVDSAGNPKADFSWVGASLGNSCNYSLTGQVDKYHPHFGNCDNSASSPLLVATSWAFKDITESRGTNSQLNLTAAGSYARNYNLQGHFGTIEAGFKFSNAHQAQDATETVYDGWATSGSSAILMTTMQSGFHNTDYFAHQYFGGNFGPVSDFNKVQNYTNANLSGYVDAYKTALASYPNIFHDLEQITSGYVMNTIDFNRLHLQTGLRFENTQMDTYGNKVVLNSSGAVPVPVTNNPGYLDALPSIQARYALTGNSTLRAVYSRGIARPDPYQLIPYVTEDTTASPTTVQVGNPALRPEHANNYDLLYEQFLQPLGMIQAGFFFKQLTAPQIPIVIPASVNISTLPAGTVPPAAINAINAYPGDTVTIYANGQNAWLYGFEVSYQQHLNFLPGLLAGFGINANYSYTDSQEKGVPLRTDHPRLIDQATHTWNISPSYDTKRFSARVGLAYNGESLFSYNYTSPSLTGQASSDPSGLGPKGPSGDVWTLPHYQLDAQASYRFYKGLSAKVDALNINNEVFGYYQGSSQFVNQREYYKATYTAGLRYNFGQGR